LEDEDRRIKRRKEEDRVRIVRRLKTERGEITELEDRADEDRKAVKKRQGKGEDKIISAKKWMRQEIRMKVRREAIGKRRASKVERTVRGRQ